MSQIVLILEPLPDRLREGDVPVDCRVKQLLKVALRGMRLRCVDVRIADSGRTLGLRCMDVRAIEAPTSDCGKAESNHDGPLHVGAAA
jgi:hypothetical protein